MLCLLGRVVAAQPPHDRTESWRWVSFGTAEGLPSPVVLHVAQGGDSTIWAGTERGLAWYDGYRWQLAALPAGVPGNAGVSLLRRDARGGILAYIGGHVVRWAGRAAPPATLWTAAAAESFGSATLDAEGAAWIIALAADGWRLVRVADGRREVVAWPAPPLLDRAGPQLFLDADGRVIVTVDGEAWRRAGTGWVLFASLKGEHAHISHLQDQRDGESRIVVRATSAVQGVWARGPSIGRGQAWQQFPEFEHEAPVAFQHASSGIAAAVLQAGDVLFCDGAGWGRLGAGMPVALATTSALTIDEVGDVWFATRSGVVLWRRSSERWTQWRLPYAHPANRVNGLAIGREGEVAAATAGGLWYVDAPRATLRRDAAIPPVILTAVAYDSLGRLWVGSGSAFAGVWQRTRSGWRHRTDAPRLAESAIHRIYTARDGAVWLLGLPNVGNGAGGLWVVRGDSIVRAPVDDSAFAYRYYDVAEDSTGTLWFATNHGLLRLRRGVQELVRSGAGLSSTQLFAVAAAPGGGAWVGSQGGGLQRIQDDLRVLETSRETPGGYVRALRRGYSDRVWAANNDGIWLNAAGRWSLLTSAFGLPTPAIWPLLPVPDGLYVGTLGAGVLLLRLEALIEARPHVVLRAPLVIHDGVGDGVRAIWSATTPRGVVPPEDIETRWRLDGGAWSAWSAVPEATLPLHVPWLRHVLEVDARTPLGVSSASPLRHTFRAPAPGWLRARLVVPLVLLFAALVVTALLLVRRRRQARILAQRLHEAERMELVGNFAAGMAHEFNNLLTTIVVNSELVVDLAPHGSDPSPASEIQAAALRAAAQVRTLLTFTRDQTFEFDRLDLREELGHLRPAIDLLFDDRVEKRWLLGEHPVVVRAERDGVTTLLRALAENARDAMPEGGRFEVTLGLLGATAEQARRMHVTVGSVVVELQVRDTGTGMEPAAVVRAFEPYYTTRTQHAGLGLALVYGLSRRFGGLVELSSASGAGTTVRVLLPLAG